MIVSNSKKYIFVHIQKTAGTSVMEALARGLAWNDLEIGDGMDLRSYMARYRLHKHIAGREIREVVGRGVWDSYFKFAFVRNPYDRAVSLYTYIRGLVEGKGYRVHLRHLPIKRWRGDRLWIWPLTQAYLESRDFSEFIRHGKYLEDSGTKPQVDWVLDENGGMMMDFIGKTENLAADFGTIAARIGEDPRTELKRLNSSGKAGGSRRPRLREEDFDFLAQLYRKDFEVFGYDPARRPGDR